MNDRTSVTPPDDAIRKRSSGNSTATLPPPIVPETVTHVPVSGTGDPSFEIAGVPPTVPGYEILAELGRGGMGVVYKARHLNLNRIVALKMILNGGHASHEDLLRFVAEAEAVAALQHPNIVQIFETGHHNGLPYFTLEYVDGGTLGWWVRDQPLDGNRAAHIVEQLARGVAYAHSKGIVHRDLKPDNVLLSAEPGTRSAEQKENAANGGATFRAPSSALRIPKITDFGLAKRVKGGSDVTHTGAVMGTPSYMSPEQAEGKKDVGAAADVYALGAILYRLVTGRPPFQAATPIDTAVQVLCEEPIPPHRFQSKLPKDLETICLKCLQKLPAKRYLSADALADDLMRFLNDEPILARPVGPIERAAKWAHRRPTVAALLVALVLGTVAAMTGLLILYRIEVDAKETAQQRGANLAIANEDIKTHRDKLQAANDETEAKRRDLVIAKAATEEKNRAAIRALEQIEVSNGLRLADEGDPSGAMLWFAKPLRGDQGTTQMEEIHRLRVALYARHTHRATLTQLLSHANLRAAAFSPDGRWILTSGDRITQVWDALTGSPVSQPIAHKSPIDYAAWSPDGRRIVTVVSGGFVQVWDAATGKAIGKPVKHPSEGGGTRAAISPEGARVVTSGEDQMAQVWDTVTGKVVGSPLPHDAAIERIAFSPDGKRIITACTDGTARVWDAETGRTIHVMKHGKDGNGAAFSPDGRFILTYGWDNTAQLWDAERGRTIGEPLPHNLVRCRPALSPDGRRLATVNLDGTIRIHDIRAGKPMGPAWSHPPTLTQISFSPDGRTLLTVGQDRAVRVWDAVTGRPRFSPLKFVEGPTALAAFSSDARHILVTAKLGVMVWDLADIRLTPETLAETGGEPTASADARVVAAVGSDNMVHFWDAVTGRPAGPPQATIRKAVQLSPNGRYAAIVGPDQFIRVTEVATGRAISPGWKALDLEIAFSSDSRRVLAFTKEGSATILNLDNGQCVQEVANLTERPIHGRFSPDGRLALMAGRTSILIWDTTNAATTETRIACLPEIHYIEFSPDGKAVVAVGPESAVWTWDTATGQQIGPEIRHSDRPTRATFGLTGKRLLIAWKDTARVYEIATGNPAGPTLTVHEDLIASFSPDGRLACLADGTEARLWDVGTAQPAGPAFHAPGRIITARFTPDGTALRMLARPFTAQDWDIRPDARPASEILQWARLYASRDLDTFGGMVPLKPEDQLAAFRELKAKSPAEFTVATTPAILWRTHEIIACFREGNFVGTAMHMRCLAREMRLGRPAYSAPERRRMRSPG